MRRLLEDMLWLARFDAAEAHPRPSRWTSGSLATPGRRPIRGRRRGAPPGARASEPRTAIVIAAPAELARPPDRRAARQRLQVLARGRHRGRDRGRGGRAGGPDGGRLRAGHPDEERERIFDRFHRRAATNNEASGAGLGLAIGDAIVQATGGRWKVGTSPTGGARFSVSWSRASRRWPVLAAAV